MLDCPFQCNRSHQTARPLIVSGYHALMIRKTIGVLARVSVPLFFTMAAFAQLPSAATLKGSYYVRYLGEDTRTPASTMSFSGTMVFDGAGGFTLTGQGASSKATDKVLKTLSSGKYSVLS